MSKYITNATNVLTTGQFAEITSVSQQMVIRLCDRFFESIKELMERQKCKNLEELRERVVANPDLIKKAPDLVRIVLLEQLPPPFYVGASFRRIPIETAVRLCEVEGLQHAAEKFKTLQAALPIKPVKPSMLKPFKPSMQKEYGNALTSGEVASLAKVAPRTTSKWFDECRNQLDILKQQHHCDIDALRVLYSQSPTLFENAELQPLTEVILEGAPMIYNIPGSKDRRWPRETALAFFRKTDMQEAFEGLESPPLQGVLFVTPRTGSNYTDTFMKHLNASHCCASASTGIETGLAMEQMRQQNGCYPAIIITRDTLGEFELQALVSRVNRKANIIAIARSDEDARRLHNSGIDKRHIFTEGENGLKSSQLEHIAKLVTPDHVTAEQGMGDKQLFTLH